MISQEKGCSNWLSSLPLNEFNFTLTKNEFWDGIRIRYGWAIPNLPARCACGEKFTLHHSLNCKKGGFVSQRHNEIRNLIATLLTEVCKDVEIEPVLHKLTGEEFHERTANKSDEARLDVKAKGFWIKGQTTYADVRIFDPNAKRYQNNTLKQMYAKNEVEKKRHYNERVQRVEQGSFSPLVFSANGGMGNECRIFCNRLCEMLAEKRKCELTKIKSWLRTILSFTLMRSMLLCLRGSRSLKKVEIEINDVELANALANK